MQIDRLQTVVAELETVGLDAEEARGVLDAAEAHLALLRRQLGVVLRLLQMAQRQQGKRRASSAFRERPSR